MIFFPFFFTEIEKFVQIANEILLGLNLLTIIANYKCLKKYINAIYTFNVI